MFSHTDSAFLMQGQPLCEWPLLVCIQVPKGEKGAAILI